MTPRFFHTLRHGWRALVDGRELDRQLDEELHSHLEMEIEHNVRRGMTPEQARTAALREFGGVARTREEAHDARGLRPLEELGRDLRIGARSLRRTPAFTTVAILTLALGIGVSTAVFSLVDGVLLRPLPYPEPDRLVRLYERSGDYDYNALAGANARDIERDTRSLATTSYFASWSATVLSGEDARRVRATMMSPAFFDVLDVAPSRGRLPVASEAVSYGASVAVVSHGYWMSSLGGGDITGRTIRVDGDVLSVIGVMPPSFGFPADVDIWVPAIDINPHRTAHNWAMIGRLAPGATIEQARAELDPMFQRLKAELGRDMDADGIHVVSLHDDMSREARPLLLTLMGAVGFVLLVACVNLASANLARAEARRRELAVRSALGAGRARLVRLVLTEQLLMAVAGGTLGVVFAMALVRILLAIGDSALPAYADVALDGRVLLFTAAATGIAALIVGLVPALLAGGDLRGAMSGGTDRPTSRGGGSRRLRDILVGTEVALAISLLIGAGLLVRSMRTLLAEDTGVRTVGVQTATVSLPPNEYPDSIRVMEYMDGMLASLRALPGVVAAGVINALPVAGGPANTSFSMDGNADMVGVADYLVVDSAAFRALDIPLRSGRSFERTDVPGAPHVALVNEALARRYWPDGDAIGHRIRPPGIDSHGDEWLTIVGVVGDVRYASLDRPPAPAIYVHAAQRPENLTWNATFVVSSNAPPATITSAMLERFRAMDANLPVQLRSLDEVVHGSLADRRFSMLVLGTFAIITLFLAAVGIYGVLAYSVARRQREIGLRMALGAHHGRVRSMVMRDAMRAVIPGVLAGILGAFALTRLLRGMLYEVSPVDPFVFVAVVLLLFVVAALASWIPARRATRVSPMISLRSD